jgi:hypothetical protein
MEHRVLGRVLASMMSGMALKAWLVAVVLGSTSWAQVTELVSIATGGAQGNADSRIPSISADGRFVAFISPASNLVAGDTNGCTDVFMRDRRAGRPSA